MGGIRPIADDGSVAKIPAARSADALDAADKADYKTRRDICLVGGDIDDEVTGRG
jgi:hypothetical protein